MIAAADRRALRILGERDVRALIGPAEALALVREAFRRYGTGEARLSQPSSLSLAAGRDGDLSHKVKGAAVDYLGLSGFRMLARIQSKADWTSCNYTYVCDNATGRLIGLVDEVWLACLRTAATAVEACRLLGRKGARRWGLLGSGRIAHELLRLLALVDGIESLRIWSRTRANAEALAARHRGALRFAIDFADDPRACVAETDMAISLTDATEPFIDLDWIPPGGLLCGMGGNSEILPAGLERLDRFVVDDVDFALTIGSAAAWVRRGELARAAVVGRIDANIGEIAIGKKPGRRADAERILAVIQGMALGDLAFAAAALRKAESAGLGVSVPLPG